MSDKKPKGFSLPILGAFTVDNVKQPFFLPAVITLLFFARLALILLGQIFQPQISDLPFEIMIFDGNFQDIVFYSIMLTAWLFIATLAYFFQQERKREDINFKLEQDRQKAELELRQEQINAEKNILAPKRLSEIFHKALEEVQLLLETKKEYINLSHDILNLASMKVAIREDLQGVSTNNIPSEDYKVEPPAANPTDLQKEIDAIADKIKETREKEKD